jgi:UPF0716 protein FxsA
MKLLLLLVLILLIPVFELFLLMNSSAAIGVSQTLFIVVVTALAGAYVLKVQGLATLDKMQLTLQQGGLPTGALFETVFILIGGIFLLIPGFITDVVGILLLIPLLRRYILYKLLKLFL